MDRIFFGLFTGDICVADSSVEKHFSAYFTLRQKAKAVFVSSTENAILKETTFATLLISIASADTSVGSTVHMKTRTKIRHWILIHQIRVPNEVVSKD